MTESTPKEPVTPLQAQLEAAAQPPIGPFPFRVGIIGSGFIVRDVALPAYVAAGVPVAGVASRHRERAAAAVAQAGAGRPYTTPEELLDDPQVEIVEIAYPPHLQPGLIRQACARRHVRAILVQKPLALATDEAAAAVDTARRAGKILAVNQNMRFDQGILVAAHALRTGLLGQPVLASIEMRAVPHWQEFLGHYDRLTIANMSVHHLDVLRYLLGEPLTVATTTAADPRSPGRPGDGIVLTQLTLASGAIGFSLEDVWVAPDASLAEAGQSVRWRITGTAGVVEGTCGWPQWPQRCPSTARYLGDASGGAWVRPRWTTSWFPDAFVSVMSAVQGAVAAGRAPANSGSDHLRTLALVDAAYASARSGHPIGLSPEQERTIA